MRSCKRCGSREGKLVKGLCLHCRLGLDSGLIDSKTNLPRQGVAEDRVPLARQAKFRDDGSLTDAPARNSEQPQREKQADLFQYERDQKNLRRLRRAQRKRRSS